MYYKTTYDPKTSKLEKETFGHTIPYFHEDKENLCTAFHARMQENHSSNCSGCQRCVSDQTSNVRSSAVQNNFCFNGEWHDSPSREKYCTNCSGVTKKRNQNGFADTNFCHVDRAKVPRKKQTCSDEDRHKAKSSCDCNAKAFATDESKHSMKFTDSKQGKAKHRKGENLDHGKDSKRTSHDETFQQKTKNKSKHPKIVNSEEAQKLSATECDGSERSKVPKASKKMPTGHTQRKSQVPHAHANESKISENVGVDDWLLFVYDLVKKGSVKALLWIPSCLSIGWTLFVNVLLLLIFLCLPVLICIWTLTKSCLLYIWNVQCSLWSKIFETRNPPETSEHQSSRPAASRQRSQDPLPEANELVSKLLASRHLDPYNVLGVSPDATDEEIKRSYRDMAKIVHPDKNAHEDASEAFQILQSAFEAIGDEEKRMAYQFNKSQQRFQEEFDDFMDSFMKHVEEMRNRIMCRTCGNSHPRSPTDRLTSAARYCSQCGVQHPAQEGDVWIETSHMGFKYYCYLCIQGQVFDVTEWGDCQKLFQRVPANSHTAFISVRPNHSRWDDMSGGRSNAPWKNKKKRKGKSNKNKKR